MTQPTRVYFGHHKSASQYVKAIMLQTAQLMGESVLVEPTAFTLPLDYHRTAAFAASMAEKRQRLATTEAGFICLSNGDREAVAILDAHRPYRGIHVIRDPRDIVVSGYYSHLYSHPVDPAKAPWLHAHRQHLQSLPDMESGLLAELEFCAAYFANMAEWDYANPRVLEMRFETLTTLPVSEFRRAYHFLGIPMPRTALIRLLQLLWDVVQYRRRGRPIRRRDVLPDPVLPFLLWRNSFARKSGGRAGGVEDIRHHYRKGIAGDWRNHFTPRVKDAFKARYPGLLTLLGYAADDTW